MSKTLIVSDNEILNQLYIINLEVYCGTEVTLVLNAERGIELIEKGDKFELIITMSMINGVDVAAFIFDYLSKNNSKVPLVVIGSPNKELPNIVIVQSSYHLQNLLRSCADILGVTSKSMASLLLPEYYSVDIKFLLNLGIAPCQVFLQIKKSNEEISYAMIAKKGSNTTEVLKNFISEGVASLYINKLDRLLVINQISKVLCDFLKSTEDLSVVEKSQVLEVGFEFVAS
ncbi:MAG: hypothetical protein Q7U04_07915, partial [Bacteriovorax sp.]|nr:hypothetical protein [Bacteriovorax sp.]